MLTLINPVERDWLFAIKFDGFRAAADRSWPDDLFCSMTLPLRLGMALSRWLIGFACGDELAEFDPGWNRAN
jgi:hypothetical protein